MIGLDDHKIVDNCTEEKEFSWEALLWRAMYILTKHPRITGSIHKDHLQATPDRVVKAFKEYFSGLMEDPVEVLRTGFEPGTYDEMVVLSDIETVSYCAHHFVPILAFVHFGYLPGKKIVGLSKIPRLVSIFSRRPQVQEKLTEEIVSTFQQHVVPKGCGCVIDALHLCMVARGVRNSRVFTRTTSLAGDFRDPSVKHEFLSSIPPVGAHSWK